MIKKQGGVTLIELMISMMLGLGVIAGIGQLFIQSQKSFKLQRNVSDMTDDATFLLDLLAKSIMKTGQSEEGLDPSNNHFQYADTVTTTVDFPAIPSIDSLVSTGIADITTLDAGEFIRGTDDATTGNSQLVYRYSLINQNDDLDGSICTSSGISYSATNDRTSAKTNKNIMVRIYAESDDGTPVVFCKASKIANSTTNAAVTSADRQPLVSEIQQLVFKYGIHHIYKTPKAGSPGLFDFDTTLDTFYYTTAVNVTNWTEVFAVKVFLVLRSSEDKLTRTPMTYSVDGTSYTATDNRIYKVFSKTIFLRNSTQ